MAGEVLSQYGSKYKSKIMVDDGNLMALMTVNLWPYNSDVLRPLEKTLSFENIVGKGENAGYQHFLLISQSFLSYQSKIEPFELR